jgi:hypothetical protein
MAANPFAEFVDQPNPFAEFAAPVSEIPAPRQGFMTKLGRGAASLADVTLGGVIPAVVQQVGYPLARVGRTPEEAQAATQRVVSAVDQPFGKAFGVSETPEYQQESGRQLLDFIGQNFQKGAKWIAENTGVPQSDVENYLGSATLAAPSLARAAAPAIEQAVVGAKMPFEPGRQARREAASLKDYARGPQLDAAADAQRLGIALNPIDIEPSVGSRATSAMAGEKGVEAITSVNKNQVRNVALNDMGLPPTTQLNSPKAFQDARAQVAKPYDEVRNLPIQQADDAMLRRLEDVRADLDVIGAKEYAPAIGKIVDDAISKTQTGLTGDKLLKNISVLRERAKRTYNNKAATSEALDIADTNLKIATELESMIDNSISNPKLLQEYRDARQKMARTYAYEGATDLNTGMVDVGKLARITSKNNALTGDIAALGRIAGNFPEAFTTKAASPWTKALSIGRTGAAGTLGGLAGYAIGQDYVSAAAGTLIGALGGKGVQSFAANRMASPGYQAGLNLRDARIPVNQLAVPVTQQNALVPYQPPAEVLMPGEGPYFPNFVMQPGRYEGRVAPDRPTGPPQLGAPSAESTLNALAQERARAAGMSRTLGQQAEAQQAAAEAAARRPTSGAVELQINPLTGAPEISRGIKGATPDVFQDFGASLKTATEKAAAGRMFDLTAAEKVAFEKTRIDLAEVAPGMKALNDKAIAAKMQDRVWVQEAIVKAQEKARGFEDIANRATTDRLRQDALVKRDQLLDLLDTLESQLGKPRPIRSGAQGPKTREAIRNKMAPTPVNKLILE